jgi:16S rRNA processing protein RimM
MEKRFKVGKIINTHGILGEVKVKRITDFEERFHVGETLYIEDENNLVALIIESHRVHKGFDLLKFEGYNQIQQVEKYKGSFLEIKEFQLTELEENEFYYHEIIGCDVFTMEQEKVGEIKEILAPGANDVWVLKRPNKKDAYIPYIEQVVKKVDVRNKQVYIDPMEGLLD